MANRDSVGNGDSDRNSDGSSDCQGQWPTAMATATATARVTAIAKATAMAMADNQWQWWGRQQWPTVTAMVTAMANGDSNGNGNGNRDSDSNGQWWWQWWWPMATATAVANGNSNGNSNGNGEGNGDSNWDSHSNGNNYIVVTTGGTREGCFFMCRQRAALWQGRCFASPPEHKGVCIAQPCTMGVPLQREFAPFQQGGSWELTVDWILFFITNAQFTKQPFVPPHHSGTQKPCQHIDTLPPQLLLHLFCKGKLGWGLHCVLASCNAVAGVMPLQRGPPSPPWHKRGCLAMCWAMGGATANSCLPHFRGSNPERTRWIGMFYFFQLPVQFTK